jgi:hypothetical protein
MFTIIGFGRNAAITNENYVGTKTGATRGRSTSIASLGDTNDNYKIVVGRQNAVAE